MNPETTLLKRAALRPPAATDDFLVRQGILKLLAVKDSDVRLLTLVGIWLSGGRLLAIGLLAVRLLTVRLLVGGRAVAGALAVLLGLPVRREQLGRLRAAVLVVALLAAVAALAVLLAAVVAGLAGRLVVAGPSGAGSGVGVGVSVMGFL